MNKSKEEEAQKKYIELQFTKHQFNSLIEQKQLLDQKANELGHTIMALNNIEKTIEDSEVLSPIGSGIFLFSELADSKHVLVSVGAGVVLKKGMKYALETITIRLSEIGQINKQLIEELTMLKHQIEQTENELQNMIS